MSANLDWSACRVLESVPGKLNGAWVFRGTRIPVSAVLKNLKEMSIAEVIVEYPSVTAEHVRSVLDFIAASADAA